MMRSTSPAWRYTVTRLMLTLAIVSLLIGVVAIPRPAMAGSNGTQIMFAVEGDQFTYLKIQGDNQYNQRVTWERSFSYGQYVTQTNNWWWKSTIVIEYKGVKTGHGYCIIDYLRETQSATIPVVYYPSGHYCSGDAGSAYSPMKNAVKLLYHYMTEDEAYDVVENASIPYHTVECVEGIAQGMGTGAYYIVVPKCAGAAAYAINQVLKRYHKYLKTSY